MNKSRVPWHEYDEYDNPNMPVQNLIAHIAQYLADIRDHLETITICIEGIADKYAPIEDKKDDIPSDPVLSKSVEILDVCQRIRSVFKDEKIHTLGDIIVRNKEEWLRCPNFGRKSLNELDDALRLHNLRLKSRDEIVGDVMGA